MWFHSQSCTHSQKTNNPEINDKSQILVKAMEDPEGGRGVMGVVTPPPLLNFETKQKKKKKIKKRETVTCMLLNNF